MKKYSPGNGVHPQENAALCDEVAHLEEKFLRAKEERRLVSLIYIMFEIFYCMFMMLHNGLLL